MKKIVIFLYIVSLISCNLFQEYLITPTTPTEHLVSGDSFTISWEEEPIYNIQPVNSNIYYRTHGDTSWIYLGVMKVEDGLEYTVTNDDLDYGIYDLGVSSLNSEGGESDIHSSLDSTSDPSNGWYINWTSF